MRHLRSLLVLSLFLTSFAGCGDGGGETGQVMRIAFTAIPNQNTTELTAKLQPVAKYLSDKLGVEVTYVPSADYAASVEMFTGGQIQVAWFGGLTGVQARHRVPGARAIAFGKRDPTFKSYFIAHVDTGIEKSDEFPMELAGKSFTFGSEGSTSGRLMPEYFIRNITKKSPKELFGQDPAFSGSHDKTAIQVQAGSVQTGAVDYTVYDNLVSTGTIDPEVARIVWVSPPYADYNWTAHPSLGDEMIEKLQTALIEMTDPSLLQAVDRPEGMIKTSNADFETLRDVAVQLELLGR